MKKYYWLASYILSPGSIIEPGNWGRIINKYPIYSEAAKTIGLREFIFEVERLKNFSDRPSRLESLFLFENEELAKKFQKTRSFDLIYEVEIIDETKNYFEGEMMLTNFPQNNIEISQLVMMANQYWEGNTNFTEKEILTLSSIKIIKKIV